MSTSTCSMTKVSTTALGTAMLSLSIMLTSATSSHAAIVGVDDSGSPFGGANTIANLGFNLVDVIDSTDPDGTSISSLSSSLGIDVSFSPGTVKRTVPSGGWSTWSHGYTGPVYSDYVSNLLTLTFSSPLTAFDFYAEPNPFGIFSITATTSSGITLTQDVEGLAGAKYFGFYSDNLADTISSITISSSENFAIGEMRLASASAERIPTPALLPGLIGMGVAALRKRKGEAVAESSEA